MEVQLQIQWPGFGLEIEHSFPEEGITAIYGPSGSGKTTLLRAIAGLDRHPGAWIKWNGQTFQAGESFCPPHLRSVGFVFQKPALFPHLRVCQNIDYAWRRRRKSGPELSRETIIELLDLRGLLERRPDKLSGGEKQRVALARALAGCPSMLLLDEPVASLDVVRKREVMDYLKVIREALRIPMLYVTHSREEIAQLADNLVLLEGGRVRASGYVAELFHELADLPDEVGGVEALVVARVVGRDPDLGLAYLKFDDGDLTVVSETLSMHQVVRVRIAARDVSLALEPPRKSSILNAVPVRVEGLTIQNKAQALVQLQAGKVLISSQVTRKSIEALGIQVGQEVYAQIKSVAMVV